MADKRVWLDLETTGLEPIVNAPAGPQIKDVPLEIGVVVTDMEGRFENKYESLIWLDEDPTWHFARDRAKTDPVVGPMHTENGLWDDMENFELRKARPSVIDAEVIMFLDESGVTKGQSALHGSSVYYDRIFTKLWFPQFFGHLHYRNVDVSTIKTECKFWNPQVYEGLDGYTEPIKRHRVIDDIQDSISEWAFYVENFLFTKDPE